MKSIIVFLLVALFSEGCQNSQIANNQEKVSPKPDTIIKTDSIMKPKIGKEQALDIAQKKAQVAYGDLSGYNVKIELVDGNWKVDYELKDKTMNGGGPHYVISGETGEIISGYHEQ